MTGKLVTLFRLKQGDFSSSAAGCDLSTSLLEAITKLWIFAPTVCKDDNFAAFDPAELRSRRKRAILSSVRWDRPLTRSGKGLLP